MDLFKYRLVRQVRVAGRFGYSVADACGRQVSDKGVVAKAAGASVGAFCAIRPAATVKAAASSERKMFCRGVKGFIYLWILCGVDNYSLDGGENFMAIENW